MIRRRGDTLQTAVDTYRHQASGRTVTLVGMMHAADQTFFAEVERMLLAADQAGAEVHYEMIGTPSPDEPRSPVEQDLLDRLRVAVRSDLIAALLGLAIQRSGIELREHWRNTDMTKLELLRALPDPERFVSNLEFKEARNLADPLSPEARLFAAIGPAFLLWAMPLVFVRPVVDAVKRALSQPTDTDVIVHARNRLAVAAALGAQRDVIATWGAAHLPGIGKGLRAAGFQRTDRRWLSAYTRPATGGFRAALAVVRTLND